MTIKSYPNIFFAAFIALLFPELSLAQLHVGAILALSGEFASEGIGLRNGFEFGLASLDPEVRKQIQVEYEDSQGLPKNALLALNSLRSRGPVDIVINSNAPSAHALAPILEKAGISLFSISADARVLTGRRFVFLFCVTPERVSDAALQNLQERGFKRLAMVTAFSPGRMAVRDELERQAAGKSASAKFQLVQQEEIAADERDFRSILTKFRGGPESDVVLFNLYLGQNGNFAQQYRKSGIRVPMFGFELTAEKSDFESANGALNGVSYVTGYGGGADWTRSFTARYPDSTTFNAANTNDLALIAGEIAAARVPREKIPEYLHGHGEFSGALGKYRLGPDNRFDIPAEIRVGTK